MIPPGVESLLAVAMLAELRRQLGSRSEDFLIAVGQQIGSACTPFEEGDTADLARWMNDIWDQLGMGSTTVTADTRRLEFVHQLPPLAADAVLWSDALPLVIEGVYRGWLHRLDPRGVLSRAATSESELKFVYSD